MKYCLSFDDVLITPKFTDVISRAHVNVASKFGNINLTLPVISANMDTITGDVMAVAMREFGAIGALHRFQSVDDNVRMFLKSPPDTICSLGITESELERFEALQKVGCKTFLIDVANAASQTCVDFYKNYVGLSKDDVNFIVGNFGTRESVLEFYHKIGSNTKQPIAIKVGIGGGSMCTTRMVTGCGWPTLQSLLDCASLQIPLIGCGGFRNSGDIAKALTIPNVMAVMIGSLIAATDETPSQKYVDGMGIVTHKKYRGSASVESYKVQGKESSFRSPEGESTWIEVKGPVKNVLEQISGGLKSAFSYVNAFGLDEFKKNSELVKISQSGYNESKAHGVK